MGRRILMYTLLGALSLPPAAPAAGQVGGDGDDTLARIWAEGTAGSQAYTLAQVLLDSIGPRLTGTPGQEAAADWVVKSYTSWGIDARNEEYGTWEGWRRGVTHVDLVEPRIRTLEATMLAWSPGTLAPATGEVVVPMEDAADLDSWLATVGGKFVLTSAPEPTCRPDDNWEEYATPESLERIETRRGEMRDDFNRRIEATGVSSVQLIPLLEEAGAAGILSSRWSGGWGVQKIFGASTERIPHLDVSCEDYGMLFRMAENGQSPIITVDAQSEDLGEVPVANTIGVIRGTELPDEYVVLSAHFDSWDGGTGATDNGTGTITMMEAMRILSETYPAPKRTILVGHWNGEEQGLNGSRAFVADHPEVVDGLQALFNQDNGTGRVTRISMQGLSEVEPFFAEWMGRIPDEISRHITLQGPGRPGSGGSDYASFICAGAPAFSISSLSWDYSTYTWHTNRDTFDKVVMDDLINNAVLTAMLAYMASESPERLSRTRADLGVNQRTGEPNSWPTCRDGRRSSN